MSTPRVHLAIPIRNVAAWLDEALESLHVQSETRWSASVVDDASEDESAEIAARWAARDSRIRLIRGDRMGLVGALNRGMADRGEAPFLARFDGDDVCHPNRLERQLTFLCGHPDIDVVDSRFSLGPGGAAGGMVRYQAWHDGIEDHPDFEREFLVENPICHPAAMFRRTTLDLLDDCDEGPYRKGDFPEDYDLWLRMQRAGAKFHKLSDRLVMWRDRPTRATRTAPEYRREAFFRLKWTHLVHQVELGRERIGVWGAKKGGRPWIRALSELGSPPVVVVDIDPKAIGTERHGVPVVAPEDLPSHRPDRVLIAVGASGARTLIEEQLGRMDIPSLAVAGLS